MFRMPEFLYFFMVIHLQLIEVILNTKELKKKDS